MIERPPNSAEWMDDPTLSVDDLRATMADQSMLHRWLGGHGAALGKVRRFQSEHPGPVRILEMACGAGDLLQEVWKAASGASERTHCIGMDRSLPVLQAAREMHPGPDHVIGDLLAPPFPDRSFDLVLLPHALHHFERDDAVMALREAARVTRGMLLVLDLVPSRLAAAAFRWVGWALRLHWASRHDGRVSIENAHAPAQLAQMAREAGLHGFQVETHPFWRVTLTWNDDIDH